MISFLSVLIGIVAGISGGFFGIGGAIVIIPLLVFIFKYPQHYAQGTALVALLLPIGILAVIKYYQAGNANIKVGLLIGFGFFIGGFIGAYFAHMLPQVLLRRLFGVLLLGLSFYMLIGR